MVCCVGQLDSPFSATPCKWINLAVHKLYDVIAVGSFECNPFGAPTCASPLRDAIATLERNWGTAHPALTELRAHLARALGVRGTSDHSESATQSRRRFIAEQFHLALDAATARHGPHHPQTARIAGAYAEYLGNDNQQYDEAAKLQESVVETYRRHFGSDDSATLEAEKTLGWWEEASPRRASVGTGADERPQ